MRSPSQSPARPWSAIAAVAGAALGSSASLGFPGDPGDPLRGPVPSSDSCQQAALIALTPGGQREIAGDSAGAADDPGLSACGMDPPRDSGAAGVWYRLIGTGNRVSIDTCAGPPLDLVLRVFCGSCEAPVCAAADDDGCDGAATLHPRLAWCASPGVEYFILVSRYGAGAGGPFVLTVSDGSPCTGAPSCVPVPPVNDACAGAAPIALGGPLIGSTIEATPDPGAPPCSGVTLRSAVWFTFTGHGRNVQVTACNAITGSNAAFAVYSGSCSAPVCVDASAAGSPPCAAREDAPIAAFCAVPAVQYFIAVSGEADGAGLFQLSLIDLGPGVCTPRGACCAAGQCTVTTQVECAGFYHGDGTLCTATLSPHADIPDGDATGLASTMLIPGSPGTITDLGVGLVISHTWQGDIRITLQHDDGPEVSLIDRPGFPATAFGFSADNFGNPAALTPMVLDDEAFPSRLYDLPDVAVPGINNPTGLWRPDTGPLSVFAGQSLSGLWTLRVRDLAPQDTGRLRAWSLMPSPAPVPLCPAGADCFARLVNGLPPTNQGNFTRGGPDGAPDQQQCMGDWDRNAVLSPVDVAAFVATWFFSVSIPGNLDADIDCSGSVMPADVATFVSHWFSGLQTPGSEGC